MTDGLGITTEFDQPFLLTGGADVDDGSFPVAINGRGFLVDLDPNLGFYHSYQRTTVSLLNTQQSQSGLDQSVTSPEVWRRPVTSWHQGADQIRYDRDDSQPSRFYRSSGIDPWKRYGFNLLHETATVQTLSAGEQALLEAIGTATFVVVGTTVTHWPTSSPSDTPDTHTLASAAIGVTSDGESLYVLCTDGTVQKRDSAGTWTTFATIASFNPAKAMIAYVKGYLLAANGPALGDITSGSFVLVYTHPLAGWWWRAASDGLAAIYVLGGIGDRWHVHALGVDRSTAALSSPVVAATLPDGEVGYALGTYLGYVLIGTSGGWRFGMPDSSGAISYGRLLETPGPVLCFEGQSRFVWFGLSTTGDATKTLGSSYAGLGRADLSVFTDPMTPAIASDLQGTTTGVTRSVVTAARTDGTGFGRRVFSVDGVGVFVEQDTLVASGWIEQGGMTFDSNDIKMGLYAQVFHEPLVGSVSVDISNDLTGNSWTTIGSNSAAASVSMGNLPIHEQFNALDVRITLNRSSADHTQGPRVNRLEVRAIDVPGRASEWRIPLIIAAQQYLDGTRLTRTVNDDVSFLIGLAQTRAQFTYREGDQTYTLFAVDFTYLPTNLTEDRAGFEGKLILYAREIR